MRTGAGKGGTDAAWSLTGCGFELRRLDTEYIDLCLFHVNDYPLEQAPETRGDRMPRGRGQDPLVRVKPGRSYRARIFAEGVSCEHRTQGA